MTDKINHRDGNTFPTLKIRSPFDKLPIPTPNTFLYNSHQTPFLPPPSSSPSNTWSVIPATYVRETFPQAGAKALDQGIKHQLYHHSLPYCCAKREAKTWPGLRAPLPADETDAAPTA